MMSIFTKLLVILCLGVSTALFYGCTQPQPAGEKEVVEEEVVEEVAAPTETPAAAPTEEHTGDHSN